jgi:hypothetical protein
MAAEGIRFTVLAPVQAKRFRPITVEKIAAEGKTRASEVVQSAGDWVSTPNASIDTTRPYLVRFESGLSIVVFFYDGVISRGVAFEGLLNSGEGFVSRLKRGFKDNDQPQLVNIATDGESYGHHHRHGEMALAYALRLLQQDTEVGLANYGSFMAEFPARYEAEINENTSWSCSHGVERWRSNCGCNGGHAGWNQNWRGPLREALDDLRDGLTPLTEKLGNTLFKDVWAARDGYIEVILDRTPDSVEHFLAAHQEHELTAEERIQALSLMEMQRHAQLMYTSCGWFFDDISGIETEQIIAYAARVLQLASDLFEHDAYGLEPAFVATISRAKSNDPVAGDGAKIYETQARTLGLTLEQVAAHYAISSVFSSYGDDTELFCYQVHRVTHEITTSGRGRLALGLARIESTITGQNDVFSYAVLHFGDQNITAAVKAYDATEAMTYEQVAHEARAKVMQANFPDVIRLLDRYYQMDYSLTSLFRDEQRRIVKLILDSTLRDIESSLKTIYNDHASLMHYLAHAGLPKPAALVLAAGFAVNVGLRHALESDPVDLALVRSFIAMAQDDGISLDTATLSYIADLRMKRAMVELQMSSGSLDPLDRALGLARTLTELPFELNLWQAQNIWYEILRSSAYSLTGHTDEDHERWETDFRQLGCCLSIACDLITVEEPVGATPGD